MGYLGPASGLGSGGTIAAVTTAQTLYVRTTGNDGNDGLTTGTALLTIQAARDKFANMFINAAVTIDVGAGTFDGFNAIGITGPGLFKFQCDASTVIDSLESTGVACVLIERCQNVSLVNLDAQSPSGDDHCVQVIDCEKVYFDDLNAQDSDGSGLYIDNSVVDVATALTGTGNTAYGARVEKNSYVRVDGVPTITGTSGNATDDRGTSAIVWATDLASDGNLTSNTDYQITIERDDSI